MKTFEKLFLFISIIYYLFLSVSVLQRNPYDESQHYLPTRRAGGTTHSSGQDTVKQQTFPYTHTRAHAHTRTHAAALGEHVHCDKQEGTASCLWIQRETGAGQSPFNHS